MLTFFNLFIFIFIFSPKLFAECTFHPNYQKVVSLSGPVSVILRELDLLKKIQGISYFNPLSEQDFQGKVYPGGVFLSPSSMKELKGGVVFYDEGRELRKIFNTKKDLLSIEIKSRNLLPLEVIHHVLELLNPFLLGCESKVTSFTQRALTLEQKLLDLIKNKRTFLFYLGELRGAHPPELLMVNDGVAKLLVKEKKMKTYPSDLSYVSWSPKILHSLPKDTLSVGLVDSGRRGDKEIKKNSLGVNLNYPGVLVPGFSQLEAFYYLFQNI